MTPAIALSRTDHVFRDDDVVEIQPCLPLLRSHPHPRPMHGTQNGDARRRGESGGVTLNVQLIATLERWPAGLLFQSQTTFRLAVERNDSAQKKRH